MQYLFLCFIYIRSASDRFQYSPHSASIPNAHYCTLNLEEINEKGKSVTDSASNQKVNSTPLFYFKCSHHLTTLIFKALLYVKSKLRLIVNLSRKFNSDIVLSVALHCTNWNSALNCTEQSKLYLTAPRLLRCCKSCLVSCLNMYCPVLPHLTSPCLALPCPAWFSSLSFYVIVSALERLVLPRTFSSSLNLSLLIEQSGSPTYFSSFTHLSNSFFFYSTVRFNVWRIMPYYTELRPKMYLPGQPFHAYERYLHGTVQGKTLSIYTSNVCTHARMYVCMYVCMLQMIHMNRHSPFLSICFVQLCFVSLCFAVHVYCCNM